MKTQTLRRTVMSVLPLLAVVAAMTFMQGRASAVVNELALWKLGEAGTFVGGLPQDSVGGHHFLNNNVGTPTVISPGAPTLGSTAALSYNGGPTGNGNYAAAVGTTVIPTDNFAIELWARSDNPNQPFTDLFSTGNNAQNGSLRIHTDPSGNWAASLHNVAWIGGASGAGQPVTVNEWTNLAVIRSNGISTFYINGIAQAGAIGSVPFISLPDFHLGVRPGGASAFAGDLDEVRIFSFNPSTDNPVAALSVNAIPEPATAGLVLLAGLALARRKQRA